MLIREAEIDDSGSISRLVSALTERFITGDFSDEGRDRLLASMAPTEIAGYIKKGYQYLVAEDGEEVVAVVAMKDNSHLYHLFVAESHQGNGLAKALWEKARDKSLGMGNPGEFTVNSSHNAQSMYEHLGFVAHTGPITKHGVTFTPMRLKLPAA